MNDSGSPSTPLTTLALLGMSVLLLSGCGSFRDTGPGHYVDHTSIPNATPKMEARSKYGNPDSYEVDGERYYVLDHADNFIQRGTASWYGTKFHGRRTSSGEPYSMYEMTAAHKTLPLPTYVQVTNLDNSHKVVVRVNDRGPFVDDRIIDLSYVAAKKLGIDKTGTGRVEIRSINPQTGRVATPPAPKPAPTSVATASNATPSIASNKNIAAADGQLYLQVGAFSDQENAAQLLTRLVSAIRENVLINRSNAGEQEVYRVRIGPLASELIAQQLSTTLSNLGITNPHLVVE